MIYNAKKMEDLRAYAKREVFQDTITSAYAEKRKVFRRSLKVLNANKIQAFWFKHLFHQISSTKYTIFVRYRI